MRQAAEVASMRLLASNKRVPALAKGMRHAPTRRCAVPRPVLALAF